MIPKNPATIKANGILTDKYLMDYFKKYFPEYGYKVTSGYRTSEDQKRLIEQGLKPAEDSAHLYNLARDFVFMDRDGKQVPEEKAKKLHSEFFTDWTGYSYFGPSTKDKGYHVHVNLPREWSKKTFWIGALVAVGAGIVIISKASQNPQVKKWIDTFKKGK